MQTVIVNIFHKCLLFKTIMHNDKKDLFIFMETEIINLKLIKIMDVSLFIYNW